VNVVQGMIIVRFKNREGSTVDCGGAYTQYGA